jgi:hypothetical protein
MSRADIVFCLILGLIALILWCAMIAWIWWISGNVTIG